MPPDACSKSAIYPLIKSGMLYGLEGQFVQLRGLIFMKNTRFVSVLATDGKIFLGHYPSHEIEHQIGPRMSFVSLVGRVIDHERILIEKAAGIRLNDVDWKGYNKSSEEYKEPHDREAAPFRTKIRGQYLRKLTVKKDANLTA
ncbi:hypothetical protein C8R47DRAFT_1190439 [Mycena vitilis]|nr:hypothetical protein C8R47DRAFT_1190439 [Mycena vitilis]